MDNQYLISVDGGGTKTEFYLENLVTGVKQNYTFGSTNYKSVGLPTAEKNMINAFLTVCEEQNLVTGQVKGMVMGVSGYDTPKDYQVYRNMIKQMPLPEEKIYVCNDSEMLFLSIGQAPGIGVTAGTGSIAIGIDHHNNRARCGGWGSPLSDFGSGYWIGETVLKKWIQCIDGQSKKEEVYDKLELFYGVQEADHLPSALIKLTIGEIASCAKIITEEAKIGDVFCIDIIKKAASHTVSLAYQVYQKLQLYNMPEIDFVLSGSIFKSSVYVQYFKDEIAQLISSTKLKYIMPDSSPAEAGLQLAKKKWRS